MVLSFLISLFCWKIYSSRVQTGLEKGFVEKWSRGKYIVACAMYLDAEVDPGNGRGGSKSQQRGSEGHSPPAAGGYCGFYATFLASFSMFCQLQIIDCIVLFIPDVIYYQLGMRK